MTTVEAILRVVSEQSGIKGVNLVLDVMTRTNVQKFDAVTYHKVLKSLVDDGKIIELEYITPSAPDRIKSLYFQKGTIVIGK